MRWKDLEPAAVRDESWIRKRLVRIVWTLVLLLVIFIGFNLLYEGPLLRRSPERIRVATLKETPVGTDIEVVRKKIATFPNLRRDENWIEEEGVEFEFGTGVVGERSLSASGKYQSYIVFLLFPEAYVSIYWAFDAQGKLIDIHVRKSYDSL